MGADGPVDPTSLAETSLAQSTLFATLSDDDRRAILDRAERVCFAAGTTIFLRGDEADGLYILLSGGVTLSFFTRDGRTFSFAFATVGALFGEIAALDGGPRSGDAVALTDVVALKLPLEAVRTALDTNPRFAEAVIRFLCARLRDTDQKLEAIALQSVEARLARFLLSAVKARVRGPARGKVSITLAISPSELSLLVGESRAQVSSALALLEQVQAFRRDGGDIICDVPILARIADQGWD